MIRLRHNWHQRIIFVVHHYALDTRLRLSRRFFHHDLPLHETILIRSRLRL
jgi:hypothetical protein